MRFRFVVAGVMAIGLGIALYWRAPEPESPIANDRQADREVVEEVSGEVKPKWVPGASVVLSSSDEKKADADENAELSAPRHIGEPLDVDSDYPVNSKERHIGEWKDPDALYDDERTEVSHIGEPMSVDDYDSQLRDSVVRHIGDPLPPPDEYYGGWSKRDEAEPKHIGEPMDVEGSY